MAVDAFALGESPDPLALEAGRRTRALVPGGAEPPVAAALALAAGLGDRVPHPAEGSTLVRWEVLAAVAAEDLTVARVVEPHLDALAIVREAWRAGLAPEQSWPADATWGVYAAEGGERLRAVRDRDRQWRLSGPKPWCSLAGEVSHALVTAWTGAGARARRGLFAVGLRQPGVVVEPAQGWVSRGLRSVTSTGLGFTDVPAEPIGGPDWYLERPGFAWGGVGVAAVWFGASLALGRRLRDAARSRTPDQVALLHLGAVDLALVRARAGLVEAARLADAGVDGDDAALVAQRVRQLCADTAQEVLDRVGHALGPAPLTTEEAHARRVADLAVYLRQHHAERDQAALGARVLAPRSGRAVWAWW